MAGLLLSFGNFVDIHKRKFKTKEKKSSGGILESRRSLPYRHLPEIPSHNDLHKVRGSLGGLIGNRWNRMNKKYSFENK
jgi:hypothetical protein